MTFLKVIQSSKKVDVVQIDKNKYKEVRNLISSASFWSSYDMYILHF